MNELWTAQPRLYEIPAVFYDKGELSYLSFANAVYDLSGDEFDQQSRFDSIVEDALASTTNPRDVFLISTVADIHRWKMWKTKPGSELPLGLQTVQGRQGRLRLELAYPLDATVVQETEANLFADGHLEDLMEEMRAERYKHKEHIEEARMRLYESSPGMQLLFRAGVHMFNDTSQQVTYTEAEARQMTIDQTGLDPCSSPPTIAVYNAYQSAIGVYYRLLQAEKAPKPRRRDSFSSDLSSIESRLLSRLAFLAGSSVVEDFTPDPYNQEATRTRQLAQYILMTRLLFDSQKSSVHDEAQLVNNIGEFTKYQDRIAQYGSWENYLAARVYHDPFIRETWPGHFGLWRLSSGHHYLYPDELIVYKQPAIRESLSIKRLRDQGDHQEFPLMMLAELGGPASRRAAILRSLEGDSEINMVFHSKERVRISDVIGAVLTVNDDMPKFHSLLRFFPAEDSVPARETAGVHPDLTILLKQGAISHDLQPQLEGYELIGWDRQRGRAAYRYLGTESPYEGDIMLDPSQTKRIVEQCRLIGMAPLADEISKMPDMSIRRVVQIAQNHMYQESLDASIVDVNEEIRIAFRNFSDFKHLVDEKGRLFVECSAAAYFPGELLKLVLGKDAVKYIEGVAVDTIAQYQLDAFHWQVKVNKDGRTYLLQTGSYGPQDNAGLAKAVMQRSLGLLTPERSVTDAKRSAAQEDSSGSIAEKMQRASQLYKTIESWLSFMQTYSDEPSRDSFYKRIAKLPPADPLLLATRLSLETQEVLSNVLYPGSVYIYDDTLNLTSLKERSTSLLSFLNWIHEKPLEATQESSRHRIKLQSYIRSGAIDFMQQMVDRLKTDVEYLTGA